MTNLKNGGPCALGDFTCRKPMQWTISEYLHFSPNVPMPKDLDDVISLSTSIGQSQVRPALVPYGPSKCLGIQATFETYLRTLDYEKYDPESSDKVQRDPNEVDIFIVGEVIHCLFVSCHLIIWLIRHSFHQTLQDHEQAWGGFTFIGRIFPDGLIVFIREPVCFFFKYLTNVLSSDTHPRRSLTMNVWELGSSKDICDMALRLSVI